MCIKYNLSKEINIQLISYRKYFSLSFIKFRNLYNILYNSLIEFYNKRLIKF